MRDDVGLLPMVFDGIRENVVVLDTETYVIVHANKAFVDAYAKTGGEVVGRKCHEVTHRSSKPCHEAGEECPLLAAAETRATARCVHIHRDADGGARTSRLTAHPILDPGGRVRRVVEISEDISEQARLQEEILKKTDFLAGILKHSPDGIIGNDPSGKVFLYNEGAERVFGYTAEEAVGKLHVSAFYPPGGAREVKEFIYADRFGGRGILRDFETEASTKDGRVVPIRLSCALLVENGREVGTIGFFNDISAQVALQNHLAESEEKFRSLFETAVDSILSVGAVDPGHQIEQGALA